MSYTTQAATAAPGLVAAKYTTSMLMKRFMRVFTMLKRTTPEMLLNLNEVPSAVRDSIMLKTPNAITPIFTTDAGAAMNRMPRAASRMPLPI